MKRNRTEYMLKWRAKNKIHCKEYIKQYQENHPWYKTLNRVLCRCTSINSPYYKKGIKNFLKAKDFKFLWFRDKAYEMKKPSIDRIDTTGNYTMGNCRFIEFEKNNRRPRGLNTESNRQCNICRKIFPLNEINFYRSKFYPLGFCYMCKSCNKKRDSRHNHHKKLGVGSTVRISVEDVKK